MVAVKSLLKVKKGVKSLLQVKKGVVISASLAKKIVGAIAVVKGAVTYVLKLAVASHVARDASVNHLANMCAQASVESCAFVQLAVK